MNKPKPFHFFVKVDARDVLPKEWNQHMIDYANYIQHRIIVGRTLWNLDDATETYTLLKSDYLRTIVPRTKGVLMKVKRALIESGVIECDGRFSKGSKSYGYRFSEQYRTKRTMRTTCKSKAVTTKIQSLKRKEYRNYTKVHKYLFKWLRKVSFGLSWSEVLRIVNGLEIQPGEVLSAEEVRDITIDACQIIFDGDVSLKPCHYGRVHTNVTRLLTAIRGLLMINGDKLVNIDIANSQPLILGLVISKALKRFHPQSGPIVSTKLTDPTNWSFHETTGTATSGQRALLEQPHANCPTDATIANHYPPHNTGHTYMKLPLRFSDSQVVDGEATYEDSKTYTSDTSDDFDDDRMDRDIPDDLYDLDEYMSLCERGGLYDVLMDRLNFNRSRKEFKSTMWFQFLYGQHQIKTPLHDLFAMDFPNVWQWILRHKQTHGYEELSRQMQRVESHLMIETVCVRLMEDHPEIPCVTVHDSVLTTPGYVDIVKQIIMDVFREIGLRPTLKC